MLERGYDKLSVYGIMTDTSITQARFILDALIERGIIGVTTGEYSLVVPTRQTGVFLRERQGFSIKIPKETRKEKVTRELNATPDDALFEKLRALRSEIASEEGVPPYVIFANRSLSDMCRLRPTSEEEFLEVNGVGEVKLERYGKRFIDVILAYEQMNK